MTVRELRAELTNLLYLLNEDSEVVIVRRDKEWGVKTFSIKGLAYADNGNLAILSWEYEE